MDGIATVHLTDSYCLLCQIAVYGFVVTGI